ncbi:MAG: hypothetical protein AAF922_04460 [Pseudomonadota bacterium]
MLIEADQNLYVTDFESSANKQVQLNLGDFDLSFKTKFNTLEASTGNPNVITGVDSLLFMGAFSKVSVHDRDLARHLTVACCI